MPKEVVHWMVAERTAELLADGPYAPALSRCPNGLHLGAVFHDALFYLRGEHPAGLKSLPHRLHGSHGEDSFDLLRLQAAHLFARQGEPLPTAFFVGLASHIFADATLHPLIYFLTGNYYDADDKRRTAAVRRHRALECLLDMLAAGGPDGVSGDSLRAYVNGLEGSPGLACPPENLARLAGCDVPAAQKAVADALETYCTMQALCRMPLLAGLLRDFSGLMPASLREIAALFYAPQLYDQAPAVEGRLAYRNPATGDRLQGSLEELMELAARRTAVFCRAQAPSLAAAGVLKDEGVGPSLDMGLPGVPVTAAKHFAARFLPAE
jgi:hypothetical protein